MTDNLPPARSPTTARWMSMVSILLLAACSSESPLHSPPHTNGLSQKEGRQTACDGLEMAVFHASSTEGIAPLKTTFTASLAHYEWSCGPVSFWWELGGIVLGTGQTATLQHTFSTPGTYAAQVTAVSAFTGAITGSAMTLQVDDLYDVADPLTLSVIAYSSSTPTTTATFSSSSTITAEAILVNPGAYDIPCHRGYTSPTNATFALYEGGSKVAGTSIPIAMWADSTVYYPPGETVVETGTVNEWPAEGGGTFDLYPGMFTIHAYHAYSCGVPVYAAPVTIVVE